MKSTDRSKSVFGVALRGGSKEGFVFDDGPAPDAWGCNGIELALEGTTEDLARTGGRAFDVVAPPMDGSGGFVFDVVRSIADELALEVVRSAVGAGLLPILVSVVHGVGLASKKNANWISPAIITWLEGRCNSQKQYP